MRRTHLRSRAGTNTGGRERFSWFALILALDQEQPHAQADLQFR